MSILPRSYKKFTFIDYMLGYLMSIVKVQLILLTNL